MSISRAKGLRFVGMQRSDELLPVSSDQDRAAGSSETLVRVYQIT